MNESVLPVLGLLRILVCSYYSLASQKSSTRNADQMERNRRIHPTNPISNRSALEMEMSFFSLVKKSQKLKQDTHRFGQELKQVFPLLTRRRQPEDLLQLDGGGCQLKGGDSS